MNRLAHFMLRLYPSRWRQRYAEELGILVEDAGADMRVVADLLRGAVSMQLSTWSFPRLAAILGVLGMLAGLSVSLLEPMRYVARTELSFSGSGGAVSTSQSMRFLILSRSELTNFLNNPKLQLYAEQRRRVPLQDLIEEMRRNTVIALDSTDKVSIQFTYPDKAKAALVVQQMAKNAENSLTKIAESDRRAGWRQPQLLISEAATLPTRPSRPAWWKTALVGLTLGLLTALLSTAVRRFFGARPRALKGPALRLMLAGSVAGAALSWIIPYATWLDAGSTIPLRWESHATLYDENKAVPLADLLVQASSRTSMAALAVDSQWNLYRDALNTHTLDDVAEVMRRDVVVTGREQKGLRFIDLSFTCPDRSQCQHILSAITYRLQQEYTAVAAKMHSVTPLVQDAPEVKALPFLGVETVRADSRKPVLMGLFAGLLVAVLFSILRSRWTAEEEYLPPAPQTSGVYFRRFRRLGTALAIFGMAAGIAVALRTPARYASTALVTFEGASFRNSSNLINDAMSRSWTQIASRHGLSGEHLRYLTWRQVETVGRKTDAFAMGFVSSDPRRARAVLQDLVGEIDRTVQTLRGTPATPYENIRGVDGALLPVTAPEDLTSAGNLAIAGLSAITTEDIPYDDERARPLPESAFRSLKMSVIDTPNLPSHAEGLGWWKVAIGTAAGLALGAILSLFGGFGAGLPATQSSAVTDPSLS